MLILLAELFPKGKYKPKVKNIDTDIQWICFSMFIVTFEPVFFSWFRYLWVFLVVLNLLKASHNDTRTRTSHH